MSLYTAIDAMFFDKVKRPGRSHYPGSALVGLTIKSISMISQIRLPAPFITLGSSNAKKGNFRCYILSPTKYTDITSDV